MKNKTLCERTGGESVLWATAFFIAAMIIFVAGRHTPTATASDSNTSDGFTLLTTSNGQGTDFVHVIDNSTSMYMVYNIPDPQNKKSIQTVATWFLPAMFNSARN
jgi:hypothetical protein